ncbi:MAG: glycosyltransferase [Acidobacteriota bacterium]|nr:glycosyltransferase [Acidobacteriota bacterium]
MSEPVFSVITCSIDAKKYAHFADNIRAVFGAQTQLVKIDDARSLTEGWTRGLASAESDLLVFCHDDIEILDERTPQYLLEDLTDYDLVGVAGASKLVTGNWVAAGFPYLHGSIITAEPGSRCFTHYLYGCGRDDVITSNIQALDGVFIACRRRVFEAVEFDTKHFDGFHLYDLDFCYAAHLAGFRAAVDLRLRLIHYSGGSYDKAWRKYRSRFDRKYAGRLPKPEKPVAWYPNRSFAVRDEAAAFSALATSMKRARLLNGRVFISRPDGPWSPVEPASIPDCSIAYAEADEHAPMDLLQRICRSGAPAVVTGEGPPEALWGRLAVDGPGFTAVAASPDTRAACTLILQKQEPR